MFLLRSLDPRCCRAFRYEWEAGVTLVESLVLVVIIGIAAAIAVPGFMFVLRRERVNAVALEVAGHFEAMRALAAEQVATEVTEGGCVITLAAPTASAQSGHVIAGSSDCGRGGAGSLTVPEGLGETFKIAHSVPRALTTNAPDDVDSCDPSVPCVGSTTIVFSPRGMWSFDAVGNVEQDLEVRIALATGGGPKRCVRMSSILGSIEIGSASDGNVQTTCTSWGSI
jgi:Tfp pilus assembly protein FimT